MSRDYLTTADVLGLHAILLERYGGASGIRDMGAVESSVYRPQCGYYADIVEEACALMESLLINQPFVDGNKRTAFAAFDIFLRINGKHLKMDSARLYTLIMHWIGLPPSLRLQNMIHDIRPCVSE